jgi:hypothetical protein
MKKIPCCNLFPVKNYLDSTKGNKYIMVVTDYFLKYVEVKCKRLHGECILSLTWTNL